MKVVIRGLPIGELTQYVPEGDELQIEIVVDDQPIYGLEFKNSDDCQEISAGDWIGDEFVLLHKMRSLKCTDTADKWK